MGAVIRFPLEQRVAPARGAAAPQDEGASIVILPVIRIERIVDKPANRHGPGRTGGGRRGPARGATRS